MILVKRCKLPLCFRTTMGLEVVFDDCLERKQTVLHVDYKIM